MSGPAWSVMLRWVPSEVDWLEDLVLRPGKNMGSCRIDGLPEYPLLLPQARWALEVEHHEVSESDEVWAQGPCILDAHAQAALRHVEGIGPLRAYPPPVGAATVRYPSGAGGC